MVQNKRKVSLTIDEDLIGALEADDANLSSQVNEAIRMVVEARQQRARLAAWLDELEAVQGPVDETEVQRFIELLS